MLVVATGAFTVGCAQSPPVQSLRMAYPHELVTMDPHAHADAVTNSRPVGGLREPGSLRTGATRQTRAGGSVDDSGPIDLADSRPRRCAFPRRHQIDARATSWRRSKGHGRVGYSATSSTRSEQVQLLEGDDRTIEITTERPAPLLLTRLESVAIVPRDFNPANPIGTGPYRWRVGSVQGPIVLERWDDYWARAPDFDEITIQFVSVLEELADLLHNQKLDVVASVTVSYVKDHEPAQSWRVVALPTVATTYLGINVTRPPLDDIRVREAIDDVIDRSKLVAAIYPSWSGDAGDLAGVS